MVSPQSVHVVVGISTPTESLLVKTFPPVLLLTASTCENHELKDYRYSQNNLHLTCLKTVEWTKYTENLNAAQSQNFGRYFFRRFFLSHIKNIFSSRVMQFIPPQPTSTYGYFFDNYHSFKNTKICGRLNSNKLHAIKPRRHVSRYFWIRNFFFPDSPFVDTYPTNSHANPQLFESALKSGNFWIRKQFGTVWTGESGYFWIRWRGKVGSSLYRYKQGYFHMKKSHINQTPVYVQMSPKLTLRCYKLTAFSILALFSRYRSRNIPKEIIRIITVAWGQRSIILIHRSFLASFSVVNMILYLILAKVSLTGVLLLSRHVSFWTLLHCTNH